MPGVHADGHLDEATAPGLWHLLLELLAATPWAIVFDLSALSALAPGAVPALVDIARRAGEADVGLYLVGVDGAVEQVLLEAQVHQLFEIHSSVDSALRAMTWQP